MTFTDGLTRELEKHNAEIRRMRGCSESQAWLLIAMTARVNRTDSADTYAETYWAAVVKIAEARMGLVA